MKPNPLLSLNHFTVPTAMLHPKSKKTAELADLSIGLSGRNAKAKV
jgi:hypothetical protein